MGNLPPLPEPDDAAHYESLWGDDTLFLPFARALAARRGNTHEPERYRSGTAVAYRFGDEVLKLYPPLAAGDGELEANVLTRLRDVAAVPSPRPLSRGRAGEWSYLWMTRLLGVPIEHEFAARSPAERIQLLHEAGRIARALHQDRGEDLPRLDDDYAAFRAERRAHAVMHHVERGFPHARRAELEALLHDLDAEPTPAYEPALLHTELGPGHLLVENGHVVGLFDFAEARAGDPEYDFAAVGLFVSRGDRKAFTAFLDGYGLPASRRGVPLVRRLMRHALLHQYGHLRFYFEASPVPNPNDLYAAAEHWFGHVDSPGTRTRV